MTLWPFSHFTLGILIFNPLRAGGALARKIFNFVMLNADTLIKT